MKFLRLALIFFVALFSVIDCCPAQVSNESVTIKKVEGTGVSRHEKRQIQNILDSVLGSESTQDGAVVNCKIILERDKTGENKISRYITEDVFENSYTVTVKVHNKKTGKTDLVYIYETDNWEDILNETTVFSYKIRNYYRSEGAVSQKPESSPDLTDGMFSVTGLSLSPAYLHAGHNYDNIAGYGYGVSLALDISAAAVKKLVISVMLNALLLDDTSNNIEFGQLTSLYAGAGYRAWQSGSFSAAPSAGIGYNIHIIDGVKNGKSGLNVHLNPVIFTGFECGYGFSDLYSFIIRPTLHLNLENDTMSSFYMINMGIKRNF
ncbi:MAG: hypothetical protein JXR90_06520 [Spirochaetes bacterium]|nr:hypothetical protein [Spirochaetota bacterium]